MFPLRVAFAGLAHSHPFTDAASLSKLHTDGADIEFVGAYDADPARLNSFIERFACPIAGSIDELAAMQPDLVIVTSRPAETVPIVTTLLSKTSAQLFVNKVAAGTRAQLAALRQALTVAPERVGTTSVLQFAPEFLDLAARIADTEVWGVRILVQHDISMFIAEDRRWQDDPEQGGGTLVTVGFHAWALLGLLAPDAQLRTPMSGWRYRSPSSQSLSEETAQIDGMLTRADGSLLPFAVTVTGLPGPEVYTAEVFTSAGTETTTLSAADTTRSLGYIELATALVENTRAGHATSPWTTSSTIVDHTIRAAQALRGHTHTEMSSRND